MEKLITLIMPILVLEACASTQFVVNSDPTDAEVFYQDAKTGDKKLVGRTPLKMPLPDLKKTVGDSVTSGEYFTLIVEKKGYILQTYSLPATRFGTSVVDLEAKLKQGEGPAEEKIAKVILDHLFVAQKMALAQQYERAQIELDKILTDFPAFTRALSMRASIFYAQKNFTESLKWYELAVKSDPQLEDAIKMIAKIRTTQSGTRLPASAKP